MGIHRVPASDLLSWVGTGEGAIPDLCLVMPSSVCGQVKGRLEACGVGVRGNLILRNMADFSTQIVSAALLLTKRELKDGLMRDVVDTVPLARTDIENAIFAAVLSGISLSCGFMLSNDGDPSVTPQAILAGVVKASKDKNLQFTRLKQ